MASHSPLRIGISGARGRMGQAVAQLLAGRTDMLLAASFEREAGGEFLTLEAGLPLCDVVVDFSTPQAAAELARSAAGRGGPALVLGATGFSPADEAAVREASARVAIVKSANYSLGVNLLLGLVEQAARALTAEQYDAEVFEAHHRRKVDAPSGTALMLGHAAARGRGVQLDEVAERGRDGLTGPRAPGAIGFSVMRGGGIVGEHSVIFAADDEIITLAHSARDRSMFARGALEAIRWVAGKPPGFYDMKDVLGL
jgi:4-hydroxy-tetrahydrodipicolinate reductase